MLTNEETQTIKAHLANLKPTLGGKLLYHLFPFRRKVVLRNMRQVFSSSLDEKEIHHLMLCFYSHLLTTLKENIQLRFMSPEKIKARAVVIGEENLADLAKTSIRGAIVITGHFGNWEFAPIAGMLNFKKFKEHFYFVRKNQSNKWLEKILFKRYNNVGLGVIPKKNALQQVYEVLEKNQIIVFVMDQYAKGKEGIKVDFFGKKTGTFRSVAMIARNTGVPVIPAHSYRRPDGKHVLEFFSPLTWQHCKDSQEEIYHNTRLYNKTLEKMILQHPEQWLWIYKRWKEEKYIF